MMNKDWVVRVERLIGMLRKRSGVIGLRPPRLAGQPVCVHAVVAHPMLKLVTDSELQNGQKKRFVGRKLLTSIIKVGSAKRPRQLASLLGFAQDFFRGRSRFRACERRQPPPH